MTHANYAAVWDRVAGEAWMFAGRLGLAVLLFTGFWIGAVLLQRILLRIFERRSVNPDLEQLFLKTLRGAILAFGVVSALGTIGINVSALVAGLGLTGFALGFAFRDILSNLLAGVLILLYHPFRRGDRISVSGSEGHVVQIDLRYTTLRCNDNVILIPNSNLFTNVITVWPGSGPAPG